YRNKSKYPQSAIEEWTNSHHSVSIYVGAFYLMFILLAILGFAGLTILTNTVYYDKSPYVNTQNISGNYLLKQDYFDPSLTSWNTNRMEACNWQFDSTLNIQDMILLAALAYIPPNQLQKEFKHLFPLDYQLCSDNGTCYNYQDLGFGSVTYFTVTTPTMVIVSIRGTLLAYEFLIDADMWIESIIYQFISILFPWSRLYPEDFNSKLIQHLSLLERLVGRSSKEQSKRFYVPQMIKILQ
ncbi:unnamed protein product, partial [Didymodactylos carnosus]